ncbi:hypothetical protein [Idiomarina abyssalis]|uniref:hypothetical protein n=1 Tax=Idiomarina abyssalis TaxID=86102 RepID=UPI003A9284EA
MLKLESYTYKLCFFISLALYRLLLDVSYVYVVVPNFGYMGFEKDVAISSYIVSWVVFFVVLPLVPDRIDRLSSFYKVLFFVSLIVPLMTFYGVKDVGLYPLVTSCLAFCVFVFFSSKPFFRMLPSIPVLTEGRSSVLVVSVILIIFLVFWYQYTGAVRFINFDFAKVYEFRSESAALANVGILSYLNSWIYQVVTIFVFSYFIFRQRYVLAVVVFFVQVFFFAVAGHKSLLFYPVLALGVWVYFSRANGAIPFVLFVFLAVSFSVIFYFAFSNVWPVSLFVRRALLVPADLTYDYFEFFSENPYVFWSNSVLSSYISYPYDQGVAKLIGEFNQSGSAANNGFISSGFSHAGFLGVIFYALVFSVFVVMLEKYSVGLPLWFSIAVTIVPLRSAIVSSDLFTVILTHGLLLTLVMILFFRSIKNSASNRKALWVI